jgi:hypothetical protein
MLARDGSRQAHGSRAESSDMGQPQRAARVETNMKTHRIAFLAVSLLVGRLSMAEDLATPEQVVRNYAATWNAGDPAGFFALQDPAIHKFARDAATSGFNLTTAGIDDVMLKYRPLFAQPARASVEIVSLTTLGEIVVTRDRVTNAATRSVANEMTMYQVHAGRITNIWYLGRETG